MITSSDIEYNVIHKDGCFLSYLYATMSKVSKWITIYSIYICISIFPFHLFYLLIWLVYLQYIICTRKFHMNLYFIKSRAVRGMESKAVCLYTQSYLIVNHMNWSSKIIGNFFSPCKIIRWTSASKIW